MARPGTGQVVVRERRAGRLFALRFRAYGNREYVTLGMDAEGWTQQRAEVELQNVLADVRRGVWRPPDPEPAPPVADPTFHEFASEWWASKRDELGRKTQIDYEWQLSNHLLPFFARHRLTQITVAEVDRYRNAKVAERALSAASINKTLTRLGQILDVADEYELIQRNPLRVNPRSRKLRAIRPAAVWLDRADQIESLLAAAGELDQRARPDASRGPDATQAPAYMLLVAVRVRL
jgi:integrase